MMPGKANHYDLPSPTSSNSTYFVMYDCVNNRPIGSFFLHGELMQWKVNSISYATPIVLSLVGCKATSFPGRVTRPGNESKLAFKCSMVQLQYFSTHTCTEANNNCTNTNVSCYLASEGVSVCVWFLSFFVLLWSYLPLCTEIVLNDPIGKSCKCTVCVCVCMCMCVCVCVCVCVCGVCVCACGVVCVCGMWQCFSMAIRVLCGVY